MDDSKDIFDALFSMAVFCFAITFSITAFTLHKRLIDSLSVKNNINNTSVYDFAHFNGDTDIPVSEVITNIINTNPSIDIYIEDVKLDVRTLNKINEDISAVRRIRNLLTKNKYFMSFSYDSEGNIIAVHYD